MCLNKRKPSKHLRYWNCANTANNIKLPLRRRTICRNPDAFVLLVQGPAESGNGYVLKSNPFKSLRESFSVCVCTWKGRGEAVRTFILDELEQPPGSSGLGCDKDFSRKPWMIEVCFGRGGAMVSPPIKNRGNPIYYFKGMTSHGCLAGVLELLQPPAPMAISTLAKPALCPQKCGVDAR